MKLRYLLLLLLLFPFLQLRSQPEGKPAELIALSYNIRFNNPDDGVNAWPNRKAAVVSMLQRQLPSVFGLQEALSGQVADIEAAFPGYGRVGVGRDDGKEAGEYSPVFFDKDRFSLRRSGTFWLSQTPAIPGSRGWDAACNRVVSWVILKDISTAKTFAFFNTHFDHMGEVARRNSAILLLHAVDSLAAGIPVIVTGDFNAIPGSEPIHLILNPDDPALSLIDSRSLSTNNAGPAFTYTGFKVGGIPGEKIDYIFIKRISVVKSTSVLDEHTGEYYLSDHLPVVAHLAL